MTIHHSIIFAKTDMGQEEIATRKHRLPPSLRRILILVDGKSDVAGILYKAQLLPDVLTSLTKLAEQGFIQDITPQPVAAPVIAPPVTEQIAPEPAAPIIEEPAQPAAVTLTDYVIEPVAAIALEPVLPEATPEEYNEPVIADEPTQIDPVEPEPAQLELNEPLAEEKEEVTAILKTTPVVEEITQQESQLEEVAENEQEFSYLAYWSETLLKQLAQELSQYVGPDAHRIMMESAAKSVDLTQLWHHLSQHITDPNHRHLFDRRFRKLTQMFRIPL